MMQLEITMNERQHKVSLSLSSNKKIWYFTNSFSRFNMMGPLKLVIIKVNVYNIR